MLGKLVDVYNNLHAADTHSAFARAIAGDERWDGGEVFAETVELMRAKGRGVTLIPHFSSQRYTLSVEFDEWRM